MRYSIKEIFYSLQGEGFHSGRSAIFCRFSGCNLSCSFCDTDFIGVDGLNGGIYNSEDLVKKISSLWPSNKVSPFVVCTGGEPLLQLNDLLIDAMHKAKFEIAIETNGTILAPKGIDWIAVSPKPNSDLTQRSGNEIKVLFPIEDLDPCSYGDLDFSYFFVQPVDTGDLGQNKKYQQLALQYCKKNPQWRFSYQLHKLLGIQ
jgi:7-carboxy-7-deazaguanine synthase (Cx14CxxC type)